MLSRIMASCSIVSWAILLFLIAAQAQNCYYPNGNLSNGTSREAPCGAKGICCPLTWQCMSDGLCYNPAADIYGRYSCTDPTWNDCPDICTYDYTAFGGEAMLWCSNGKWCCDGNRSGDCCTEQDTNYLALPDPKSTGSITALVPVTTPASTVHNGGSTTPDSATTSSGTTMSTSPTPSTHTTPSPATFTHKSTTTGANGAVVTITQVTTLLPSGTGLGATQGQATSHSGNNLGLIVGLALGITLVLVLASILGFVLYRRRRRNDRYANIVTRPSSPPAMANYSNIPPGTHAPEIAGFPIADTRDKDNRKSELYGNDTYIYSPKPPSYSSDGRSPTSQAKSPAMAQIREEPQEPQELWGGYVPYRPQNAHLAQERRGEAEVQSPVSPLEQS